MPLLRDDSGAGAELQEGVFHSHATRPRSLPSRTRMRRTARASCLHGQRHRRACRHAPPKRSSWDAVRSSRLPFTTVSNRADLPEQPVYSRSHREHDKPQSHRRTQFLRHDLASSGRYAEDRRTTRSVSRRFRVPQTMLVSATSGRHAVKPCEPSAHADAPRASTSLPPLIALCDARTITDMIIAAILTELISVLTLLYLKLKEKSISDFRFYFSVLGSGLLGLASREGFPKQRDAETLVDICASWWAMDSPWKCPSMRDCDGWPSEPLGCVMPPSLAKRFANRQHIPRALPGGPFWSGYTRSSPRLARYYCRVLSVACGEKRREDVLHPPGSAEPSFLYHLSGRCESRAPLSPPPPLRPRRPRRSARPVHAVLFCSHDRMLFMRPMPL